MNAESSKKSQSTIANRPTRRRRRRSRKYHFNRAALANLSPGDIERFEQFGQGPIKELPFSLIHEAFEYHVRAMPEAIAVQHRSDSITYQQLDHQANQLAAILAANGIGRGDFVGLFLQRSIPMIVGIVATLKAGAAYVPQHLGVAPESQLRQVMSDISAKVVLTISELQHLLPQEDGVKYIAIDEILTKAEETGKAPFVFETPGNQKSSDPCFVIFTSGTTGKPNGVQVTHQNVCNILLTAPGNLGIRPGMKVGQILSIAFDMAAWEILGSLGNGATLVIRGKDFMETARQVDVLIATPSVLGTLDADGCHNVRVVAVAGEPCPRPLADKWSAFCTFYNSCGPTETTIINTAQNYNAWSNGLTIGKPTPNNTVYVLDENRNPLPIGEVGEMWAGGDCVSAGYLKNPALTAERYAPDPFLGNGRMMFRTRDLGRWTPDGELEHFGRTDDQVKIRGFRVELDSVSGALESTPSCDKAVTLKLDNRSLVAFVSPQTTNLTAAKNAVSASLPYYCIPSVIIPLDDFPMTSRGKVDKRALMELARSQSAAEKLTHNNQHPTKDAKQPAMRAEV